MKSDAISRFRHTRVLICIFSALMLCLIWVGLYFVVQRERQAEIEDAYKDGAAYAQTFAEHTVRTIRGLEQIAIFLKFKAEQEGLAIDIPRLVSESRFTGQPFVLLSVVDETGQLVSSSQRPFIPSNIKDREHFRVHQDGDKGAFLSKPVLGRSSGKWSLQLSRRINKPDGSFGGVVVVSIDPYYFAAFYRLVNLGDNSSILLVGRDGIVRARQSGGSFSLGQDIGERIRLMMRGQDAGNFKGTSMFDGITRYLSFQSLDDYSLVVIVGVSEEETFAGLNQRLKSYYWACSGASALILLYMGILFHDIARRRRAELKLRQSEETFRYMTEGSSDVIWHLDGDFRFDYISPSDERLRGFSQREMLGQSFWSQLRPAKADYVRQQLLQRLAASERQTPADSIRLELELHCKDGGWLWTEVNATVQRGPFGQYVGLHGVTRDISERKRAEKALMESQVRYHALVEQSFEALALIDLESRETVEVNRRFTELLGYSLPDDAPLLVEQYTTDSQSSLDYFYGIVLKQHRLLPVEMRLLLHKNGAAIAVERAGTVISIGGRDYLLATLRDITDERRRQTEAARDLELAQRVQLNLLPELPESPRVTLRTLYYPSHFVSGDSYHLEWRNDGTLLCGYLIDVSGHGVSTALQTASLMALLRESSYSSAPLLSQMKKISSQSAKYFTEGSYAAMLGFELDLATKTLHYVAAGITQFYFNGEKILTPSLFVGILPTDEFCAGMLPVADGDCLLFLTDGFTDRLNKQGGISWELPPGGDFDDSLAVLEELAARGQLRDDSTAICIQINA